MMNTINMTQTEIAILNTVGSTPLQLMRVTTLTSKVMCGASLLSMIRDGVVKTLPHLKYKHDRHVEIRRYSFRELCKAVRIAHQWQFTIRVDEQLDTVTLIKGETRYTLPANWRQLVC
jgi:hypothetical protein